MIIRRITICNIKKFAEELIIDLSKAKNINAISGKNGTGKSTVFECVMLVQKAYFVKLIKKESDVDENVIKLFDIDNLYEQLSIELRNIVYKKNLVSRIELEIRFLENDFNINKLQDNYSFCKDEDGQKFIDVCLCVNINSDASWSLELKEGDNPGVLGTFWNLKNPINIVVLLDADKDVYEEDFTYQKISMMDEDLVHPAIKFVLNSKKIYQDMYSIMMNAYVYQRLNPLKPARNAFVINAQKMFNQLISSIKMVNVSGKAKEYQFIQMANHNKQKYDARNMSSGEKLIWYSSLILNYIKYIGVLIIDEPENHLHEKLAWKYVQFLEEVCRQDREHKNLGIGQVFLVTHSKNLIYNNFCNGINYVITTDGDFQHILKEECEDMLRKCGVSYIDDNILFVEGVTEVNLLGRICEARNIKLKELANCGEIEQIYQSMLKVKDVVYAPKFAFMIDKDTKEDSDIEWIKNKDENFFDKHFIILPVHEFENLLLDNGIITEIYNDIAKSFDRTIISEEEMLRKIETKANDVLIETKKKYLNAELHKRVANLARLIKKKDIAVSSQGEFEHYISNLIAGDEFNNCIKNIKETYIRMDEIYRGDCWKNNWLDLCDGKTVFNLLLSDLSGQLGVSSNNIKDKIIKSAISNKNSKLNKFLPKIYEKFDY